MVKILAHIWDEKKLWLRGVFWNKDKSKKRFLNKDKNNIIE